ncbi:hypothetical protein WA158_002022 [Blastocystis sp. Blastoise]
MEETEKCALIKQILCELRLLKQDLRYISEYAQEEHRFRKSQLAIVENKMKKQERHSRSILMKDRMAIAGLQYQFSLFQSVLEQCRTLFTQFPCILNGKLQEVLQCVQVANTQIEGQKDIIKKQEEEIYYLKQIVDIYKQNDEYTYHKVLIYKKSISNIKKEMISLRRSMIDMKILIDQVLSVSAIYNKDQCIKTIKTIMNKSTLESSFILINKRLENVSQRILNTKSLLKTVAEENACLTSNIQQYEELQNHFKKPYLETLLHVNSKKRILSLNSDFLISESKRTKKECCSRKQQESIEDLSNISHLLLYETTSEIQKPIQLFTTHNDSELLIPNDYDLQHIYQPHIYWKYSRQKYIQILKKYGLTI